jgi:hypothetical protein
MHNSGTAAEATTGESSCRVEGEQPTTAVAVYCGRTFAIGIHNRMNCCWLLNMHRQYTDHPPCRRFPSECIYTFLANVGDIRLFDARTPEKLEQRYFNGISSTQSICLIENSTRLHVNHGSRGAPSRSLHARKLML